MAKLGYRKDIAFDIRWLNEKKIKAGNAIAVTKGIKWIGNSQSSTLNENS